MDWLTHRRRALLYTCAFLMDMGVFCGYTMIFLLLRDYMGAGLTRQGLLALLQLVVYLALCPAFSRLARARRRRHRFVVVGPLLLSAAYLLISGAGHVWQVGAVMWVSAAGAALFWPQLEAEIGHGVSGTALSRRMGLFNLSWSIGSTPAPFVAGLLYVANPRLPFIVAAGTALLVAGILWLYRRLCRRAGEHIATQAPARERGEPHRPALMPMPALLVAFVWLAWFGNFVAYANQSVSRTLFQNLGGSLGYSAPQIGWLMALLGVTRTAALLVLQRLRGWVYRARYLFLFQGVMLVGVGLLCVPAPAAVAAAGMALVGLGAAMAYTASMFYSVEGAHHGKASAGLHEAVLAAGGAVGLLLAGQVAPLLTDADPRSPFYACAALTAACLAVQVAVYVRYRRRRRAAQGP